MEVVVVVVVVQYMNQVFDDREIEEKLLQQDYLYNQTLLMSGKDI